MTVAIETQTEQVKTALGDLAHRWVEWEPPRVFLVQAGEVGWEGRVTTSVITQPHGLFELHQNKRT
jgi:hypothetical protein